MLKGKTTKTVQSVGLNSKTIDLGFIRELSVSSLKLNSSKGDFTFVKKQVGLRGKGKLVAAKSLITPITPIVLTIWSLFTPLPTL